MLWSYFEDSLNNSLERTSCWTRPMIISFIRWSTIRIRWMGKLNMDYYLARAILLFESFKRILYNIFWILNIKYSLCTKFAVSSLISINIKDPVVIYYVKLSKCFNKVLIFWTKMFMSPTASYEKIWCTGC